MASALSITGTYIALTIVSAGSLVSLLFCIAILSSKRQRLSTTDALSLGIAAIQGGFALNWMITLSIYVYMSFEDNTALCRIQGFLTHSFGNLSLTIHTTLALDRYVHTTTGKQMSSKTVTAILILLSCFCLSADVYLLSLPNGFDFCSSRIVCVFTLISQDTLLLYGTYMNIITNSICFGIMMFCYGSLYMYFQKLVKTMGQKEASKANPTIRALLYRCISIAASFVACWSLVIIGSIYIVLSKTPLPPILDLIAILTCGSQPFVTTLVLLHTHKVYLDAFKGMLGFDVRSIVSSLNSRGTPQGPSVPTAKPLKDHEWMATEMDSRPIISIL